MRKTAVVIASSLAWLLPLAPAASFLAADLGERVDFVDQELDGTRYLRPLAELLEGVTRHRLLARRALLGMTVPEAQRRDVEADVDRAFADLASADARLGRALRVDLADLARQGLERSLPSVLRALWTSVKAPVADASASDARHDELLAQLRALYRYVGDTSNLILDPELDTYYVMDAFLLREPAFLEQLGGLRAEVDRLGEVGAPGVALDLPERLRIDGFVQLLDYHAARLKYDLGVAFTAVERYSKSAELRPALSNPGAMALDAMADVASLTRAKLLYPATPGIAGIRLTQFADQAIQAGARLWPLLFDQEDTLLRWRRARQQARERRAFLLLGAAYLVGTAVLLLARAAR